MNKATRTDLLDALAELGNRYPDWRLGQLISNLAGWADQDMWDADDEQLLAAAKEHLRLHWASGIRSLTIKGRDAPIATLPRRGSGFFPESVENVKATNMLFELTQLLVLIESFEKYMLKSGKLLR